MRRHLLVVTLLIAGFAAPAWAAPRMNAAIFLAKADSLRRRGPLALFSSDLKVLQAQAETAGDELKAEHDAAKRAGRPLTYCPPNRKILGPQELLDGLHRIPAPELARLDIKQAMHVVLVRNYPC
ncbi:MULTISPECIES: hypothetical protein [Sphingomonas]|uniref:hypothetical protein n=1 Tax=Sphingomonas TaxID=13687 RepID=UPI000DEFA9E5|nr:MULTISPECIES: hypothetical protein [Sphingomonas]